MRFDGARQYNRTGDASHASSSFQAEITLTLKGGGPNACAFFGIGTGQGNPQAYHEPTTAPSLSFRFAPSDFASGTIQATVDGKPCGEQVLGDGTHRLRLTWDATLKRAWLEIHPNWTKSSAFQPTRWIYLPAVTANFSKEGRIFAGGGGGVIFEDFTVKPLPASALAQLPAPDVFRDDASARTWLPTGTSATNSPQESPATREIDAFLKEANARLRPLVCWYSNAQLEASRSLSAGKLELPGSSWDLSLGTQAVEGTPDARDVTLSFTLRKGMATSSGVAAAFDFTNWSEDNYVLIPAAVYNGNRYRTVGRGYAAGLDPADQYRKDLPLTQSNVPRLSIEKTTPSKLEVNSSNVTTPAVCIFDRKAKRGFILLAEQGGRDGANQFLRNTHGEILDHAFAIEESADRSRATIVVSAPGVRESKPEFIGFSNSPDRGIAWKAGDTVRMKFRVYSFATPDIPGLLDRFMSVRKSVTGPNHPRLLIPASQVATWMTQRIDSRYLQKGDVKFYCPENGPWIAFGWIGGWINTFPMLTQGDEMHLERATNTFNFGLKAQEPSGYFHYAIRDDGNTSFRDPGKDMNLARTSGDTLFWMMKQFLLLKAQDRSKAIQPEWEASMKKLADAMVTTWRKNGEWGKLINVKTGEVAEYNTTGGASIIGGLALASGYYRNEAYLATAKDAAEALYQRDFVKQGQTSGGCADILQNADSETAAAFMTSLMALYEVTGEKRWWEMSRNLANLVATWTVSHDYELPKSTELGGLGAKLAGVYWASTQNKHGAPGICTTSADALLKIYRINGDTRYAELLRDLIRAHGESIRPGGFTNERLTFCDAESRGSRGDHVTGWNETNGILMAQEIPGIYLRTDVDRFYVFDAVEAKVLKREAGGVTLTIRNPTQHDAQVSIFAENASQAAKPQGYTALLRWPKVPVKAGAEIRVTIAPDGSIRTAH